MYRERLQKIFVWTIAVIAIVQSPSAFGQWTGQGSGTIIDPYLISTELDLTNIKTQLTKNLLSNSAATQGKYFRQTADIVLSPNVTYVPCDFFFGNYDGNGYTITGLKLLGQGGNGHGLFGECHGGIFNNIGLVNVDIHSGNRGVGALMGQGKDVTIENCYATGKVSTSGQGYEVGGLVGVLIGDCTVTSSYFSGEVWCKKPDCGGLIGIFNDQSANFTTATSNSLTISKCYVSGTFYTSAGDFGLLIGAVASGAPLNINNSYVDGEVNYGTWSASGYTRTFSGTNPGTNRHAGILSAVSSSNSPTIVISNVYSNVDLTGSSGSALNSTNAFISFNNSALGTSPVSMSNCYYNSYKESQAGPTSWSGTWGLTGLSEVSMQNQSNYSNWDFTLIWEIDPNKNSGLPFLRSSPVVGQASTTNIWNGTVWSKGTPSGTGSLDLQDDYTVNSATGGNISAATLNIAAGKQLTIDPGFSVKLTGNLTNNGSTLLLNSSSSNGDYSQLKFDGTFLGNGNVKQTQNLETGSHLVSSPMAAGFASTRADATKLYAFDAATGNWFAMGSQTGVVGAGFAARVDPTQIPFITSADTVGVSGTPNTSNTWTISNASLATSTGSGAGWNLLGNPYTCGLDFSNVYSNNSSLIENAFYIWDAAVGGGAGGYVYYSGGGLSSAIIPPMQAFWVQAKPSQSGSITTTMSADGTVASSPTYYKSRPDNLVLHAALLGDTLISDRMWVAHVSGTTSSFDGAYDAWKMTNGPSMPNIYSYVDAEGIAINALDLNGNQIIPVGFDFVDVGAKFRITLEQVTNGQVYQVYLEDKALQQFHDLNQGDYPFTHQVWTQEEPRFALHVSQSTVGTEESDASPTSLVIYRDGARLMVHWYDSDQANYRLVTVDGKEVSKGAIESGLQSLDAPEVSGVYILELAHPHGIERQKFLVTY